MNGGGGHERGIVLIHPPVTKACEAPGGLARLAGALGRYGVACRIWDANLEGQLALLAVAAGGRTADGVAANSERMGPGNGETIRRALEGVQGITSAGSFFSDPEAEEATSHRPSERGGKSPSRGHTGERPDTWTRRAARHLAQNLDSLKSWEVYANPDRYRRTAADVNRLLAVQARPYGVRLTLADYEDKLLSPVRSADLLQAAAAPESNPFYPWFRDCLPEVLAEMPRSPIGFSLNYLSQALTTFAMTGFIRRTCPERRIVLGGGLVTSWMRAPGWRNPFAGLVDELIAGPGEAPLLALSGEAHDGGHDRPDFGGFPLEDYLAPGRVLPYSASGGCWWRRCSFCPEVAEGNRYRPEPPKRVMADLHALTAQIRPALIHFLDNALNPALLGALAADPPGAPWYGFARITPHLADPEFCRQLKDSGCVMLKLGLESGDQVVLDALRKGVDLETATAVLKNLKATGIATYVYLLFGTPAETPEAAGRTLAFTVSHSEEIDFLNLAIFNLPAYGPETEELVTGEFYAGDLPLYRPFNHPQGWNRGDVRRFLENEFKRHPAMAAILRRDPPCFTSNHAPFAVLARTPL